MNTELISVGKAKNRILDLLEMVEREVVPIGSAAGRILAENVIATTDSPIFSNSSMDGFAVVSSDTHGASKAKPINLKLVGDVPAGLKPSLAIKNGETMRVMTGAMIPAGANAIIPVEKTNENFVEQSKNESESIEFYDQVKPGDYIRKKGEDFKVGEPLLSAGNPLRPQDLSILAMMGIDKVLVFRKPKIGIFSSGDELVPVNEDIGDGKIRESNSYALSALIERTGAEVINFGIAKDNIIAIEEVLQAAVEEEVDMIISTAGVSVGKYDFIRSAIEKGGEINFWKVNMRPGKPLVFGAYKGITYFGLPGNPVSSYIGFEVFIKDAIKKIRGENIIPRKKYQALLDKDMYSDGRESFLRSIVTEKDNSSYIKLASHQGSGNIFSLVKANSLLIVPAGIEFIPAGDIVEFWYLNH